jgi:hypothetical protein
MKETGHCDVAVLPLLEVGTKKGLKGYQAARKEKKDVDVAPRLQSVLTSLGLGSEDL